jgi:hypothetical protein
MPRDMSTGTFHKSRCGPGRRETAETSPQEEPAMGVPIPSVRPFDRLKFVSSSTIAARPQRADFSPFSA